MIIESQTYDIRFFVKLHYYYHNSKKEKYDFIINKCVKLIIPDRYLNLKHIKNELVLNLKLIDNTLVDADILRIYEICRIENNV